jgi:hypothetical protein
MASNVNRCAAIAAHGRRCQQTTHGQTDYCWHHGRALRRAAGIPEERIAPPEARLASLLGPDGTARLVAFLESGKAGRVRLPPGSTREGLSVSVDPRLTDEELRRSA